MTNAVNLASAAGTGFFRNKIINGALEIAQRGTSGTSGYLADRWQAINTSAQSISSDAPDGFSSSLEFTSSSATFPFMSQRIERINSYDLAGKTVTLSFWAKSVSGSSNLYVELYRANSNDNFSGVTFETGASAVLATTPSTSWTYYTATFTLSSSATTGLEVRIIRNNASASSTRVTGVQFEIGSQATPFERRNYQQELAMCQRYTVVLYNTGTPANGFWGTMYSTTAGRVWTKLPVTMRASPTLTATNGNGTFEILAVATVATATIQNVFTAPNCVTFDGTLFSSTANIGHGIAYRGPGIISAEL